MDQQTQQIVERMGLHFEQDGLPRIAGRLLGYLLLSAEPKSLDELAEALRVSKSSVSTDARLLERMGTVERVAQLGDRRDFYRIACDLPERIGALWAERLKQMAGLLSDALGAPAAESESVQRRLSRGLRMMEVLTDAIETARRTLEEESSQRLLREA